ncbi:hypothetical protein JOC95_003069 [Bacillus tianshenii]|uniref:Uncharacterized protein n=1 Tax=Sutcliffiella tianshenii TaxID=1463404 RepID=A0ABS2P2L8_9BACI|nr:hypothetical protein [Bacillus tianshenii]
MNIPGIFFVVIILYLFRIVFDKKYTRKYWEVCLDVGVTFLMIIIFQYFMKWLFF